MTIVGANPDELDALAEAFDRSAGELRAVHADVARLVRRSPWDGRDAEQFEAHWRQRSRAAFDNAGDVLDRAAHALHRNADEQRRTSSADGAWAGAGAGLPPWLPTRQEVIDGIRTGPDRLLDALRRAPLIGDAFSEERMWARGEGREQLADMVGRSPADQLAWWRSLTDEQRDVLLAMEPGGVLALDGLPADVRSAANHRAIDALQPTIATATEALSLEAGANIKIVSIGAEGEAVITEYADGHVEVSLGGELAVGVGPKGTEDLRAELRLTGSAAATWTFADQAGADRFVQGLLEAPLPDDVGDWFQGLGSVVIPGATTWYLADEVSEYLRDQSDHYSTTTLGAELSGDVKIGFPGVGDIEVHGGVGVEYDTAAGTTTAYLDASASGSTTLAPWAGAAAADTKLAVTWAGDGSIESMAISGHYSAQSGSGFDGPVELTSVAGTNGSYEVQLDLSDPANRSTALDLLAGVVDHDPGQAAGAFSDLVDASQVIVQTNVVSTTSFGVDAVVVSAGGSGEVTTNVGTFVKPSHGDFTRMTP